MCPLTIIMAERRFCGWAETVNNTKWAVIKHLDDSLSSYPGEPDTLISKIILKLCRAVRVARAYLTQSDATQIKVI